jgi:hypothetical protein
VVLLAVLFALFTSWRVGLVLLFTVAIDFVTNIWMVLPGFSLGQEVVLIFAVTLPLGVLVGAGKRALTPVWLTGAIGSGVLAVLQLSSYVVGFAQGTLDPGHALRTVPAALMVVVASGIGLLLPAVLFRRRQQASARR